MGSDDKEIRHDSKQGGDRARDVEREHRDSGGRPNTSGGKVTGSQSVGKGSNQSKDNPRSKGR